MKNLLFVTPLLVCLSLVPMCPAATTVYEGFSSAANGADLHGYSGGSAFGLTGTWDVTGSGAARQDTINRTVGPLWFPNNVIYPRTNSGANYQWAERNSGSHAWGEPSYATRPLASPINFAQDGTFYVSYLARMHSQQDSNMMVGLSDGTDLLTNGINYYAGTSRFGFSYGPTPPGTNTPGSADSGIPVTLSQSYFIVAEIKTQAAGPDTISYKAYNSSSEVVHSNPTQLSGVGAGANQWTMQQTITASNVFDRLYAKADGPAYPNFDELRIGSTWTDVTGLDVNKYDRKIGLNFVGGDTPGGGTLTAGDVAGTPNTRQANWNNLNTDWQGNSGAVPATLVDNAGSTVGINNNVNVGVRVSYDSNTVWGTGVANTNPDRALMRGYLDDAGVGSSQPYVILQNLPYQKYDVLVYIDGDQTGGVDGPYWLENNTTSAQLTNRVYVRDQGHFDAKYTQTPVSSTSAAGAVEGNYILFEGVTARDLRIRATQDSGTRAPINGVQILDRSGPVLQAPFNAIGFNFIGGGTPGGGTVNPNELAGASGYAQTNWNNLSTDWSVNAGAVPATVLDNYGRAVGTNNDPALGIQVRYDANNLWGNGIPADSPNQRLMRGYLDSNGSNLSQPYVIVSNVPYVDYNVVLYVDGDVTNGPLGEYWLESLDGTRLTPGVFAFDRYHFAGRFDLVGMDSTIVGQATEGNYIVFEDLSASEFRIRGSQVAGTRAPINAFQIVENVPEPATIGLLSLAACGLCGYVRRRRGA